MAAKTIKGITVEIDGNTTGLGKALKAVESNATDLAVNLKKVNDALKLDPGNTELLAEKQKVLADSVSVTREKLETLKGVQDQIKQQYENGEIGQSAYLDFQKELENTEVKLKRLEEQQKNFGSIVQQQMEAAGKKVSEFGDKVSDIGESMTKGVTTPIAAVGTAAVAAFNKVDDGVDVIVKATGAQGEALDGLVESYKMIASEMPADMEVVAAAVGEVNTRFHTTGEALEDQTRLLIKYAEITGGDVVQATDDADKTLKAWGMSAESLPDLLGMVASKAQETGINAQSLMQNVQQNASSFKELGFTLEESINLMAQMDANGVDSSTALMGLKKAVVNLTDSGMAQDEALRTVIERIKNATTETEALQIAQETFGTKGAAEMATAIREGRIAIDALSDSTKNYSSVVEDTFNGVVGDASDEAKIAMNAVTVAGSELGETLNGMLAPILSDVAEIIRNVTAKLNGMDEGQKQTIIKIALLVAAIGPALAIGGKVISGIGSAISAIGKIRTAISGLGSVISFLAANPVVLIIAGIVGLVAALVTAYNKCEWFREGVNAAIQWVSDTWNSCIEGVKGFISGLGETWSNVTAGIKNVAHTAMTAAQDTVREKLSNIKSAYEENGGGIKGIVAASQEAVKGFFTAGLTFVDKLTGGKLSSIADSFRSKLADASNWVHEQIEKIKNFFNFSWSLPKLKMPHFSITGNFSLNPLSVPRIGVEWYAKGGILNGAQIFGSLGDKWLGGGESGPEAVLPLNSFYENLKSIMAQSLDSDFTGGVKVEVHIDHFENYSNNNLDEIVDYVEDQIQYKAEARGAVFT